MKKCCAYILVVLLLCTSVVFQHSQETDAARLNRCKLTIRAGKKFDLKLIGTGKVTWATSNKKIVKINKRGVVTAVKAGKAKVMAASKGKAYICNITVIPKVNASSLAIAKKMLKLVNAERTKRGLSKLKLDKKLCQVANDRAIEISECFSHMRPDGRDCFSILDENGVRYGLAAENIAGGQPSEKIAMNSFMGSPGHKKNILHKDFKKLGVGFYKSRNRYKYNWVQFFTS